MKPDAEKYGPLPGPPVVRREGGLLFLPVLHYRLEFAEAVRRAAVELEPERVAVELPPSVAGQFLRGVERLPQVSALLYEDREGQPVYLPVEPTDPIAEACRWARGKGVEIRFIDIDTEYTPRHQDRLPDPYAVRRLGLAAYWDLYRRHAPILRSRDDERREKGMAWRLRPLADDGLRTLVVLGMAHLPGVLEELRKEQARPLERTRPRRAALFNLHPRSVGEVMGEPAYLAALYEMRRGGLPPEPSPEPPAWRKKDRPFNLHSGGRWSDDPARRCEASLRWAARRVHEAGAAAREPGPETHLLPLDRQVAQLRLFERAELHYLWNTGETVRPWQKELFFRFGGRLSRLERQLSPDFFDLLHAARASVDDNFCYEMWDLGTFYPWQRETSDLPTVRIRGEDIWFGSRKMRIRRFIPRRKARRFRLKKRRREKYPGQWLEGFDGSSVCSHPPEDLRIEGYGHFLKKKGVKLLSEELSRVEPFGASLLDGVDMRETIRNWHEGRKIYVRENRLAPGRADAVVVIFDEDRGADGGRYPFKMTWHGEHHQESDMAFYSTPPASTWWVPASSAPSTAACFSFILPASFSTSGATRTTARPARSPRSCSWPPSITPGTATWSTPLRIRPARGSEPWPAAWVGSSSTSPWLRFRPSASRSYGSFTCSTARTRERSPRTTSGEPRVNSCKTGCAGLAGWDMFIFLFQLQEFRSHGPCRKAPFS